MRITIITLFPNMISGFFNESIIKRAQSKGLVDIELINLRDFAIDSYGTVDDKPYGGGVGMVLRPDVLQKALKQSTMTDKNKKSHVILTSAKGHAYNQYKAQKFSTLDHLVIIAGHYEGVDERIMKHVDEEVSLGDFVMTGGEITAAAITDSIVRLLPGVLKHEEATANESFFMVSLKELIDLVGETYSLRQLKSRGINSVQLLEYPQYTRPEDFEGTKPPDVLLSGNHKEIEKWRLQKAYEETLKKRPDLLQ